MAPKTRKSNQKEAAAKTQQSKQNEVNRGKGRASQKRVRNKITDNNNEKNSDDNINHNERESDLLGNFSDNREESLENLSDDDNNDNNDVFFLQASKYISDIVKEVLGDNQDYQDSFEPIQTGKNSSLTTSEAITPSRGRTSSLVPEATTPIRAGRIASLVPDVVTPPRTRSILSLLLGDDEPLPASFTEMSNILEVCNWLVKRPHILELANQIKMAPKTRKSNQKEAAAKTQQSKQNEVNRGKGRASQKRVRNKITDNNNEKNSDDNINHNERESDLLGNFSDNREESLENLSDDDNNDNNDVFFLQASKYISDIVKEVLGDNQDYQDSFEPIQTGKNSSLTTSEAITPSRGRTSSLVPEATTPIRAGRIASLVPDVVTPPRTRSILSLLLGDDEPLPASFTEMSNILEVCNWLVKRPHILELANQMLTANNTSSNTNMVMNSLHGNGNLLGMVGENKSRLWDEESKCLILHIRNPSSSDLVLKYNRQKPIVGTSLYRFR
ncbi:hypothetical protein RhiirA4_483927 [Rhizophagus irregularis]|uniref:Uncharacterized protein n=1 Tax=Rhizophagus irregularis TaxID=588596 RepID=A0A2I1HN76_9GLOM|nr:hypothetical protein RhiirA4_483927 [Rhizophagus irregularis]